MFRSLSVPIIFVSSELVHCPCMELMIFPDLSDVTFGFVSALGLLQSVMILTSGHIAREATVPLGKYICNSLPVCGFWLDCETDISSQQILGTTVYRLLFTVCDYDRQVYVKGILMRIRTCLMFFIPHTPKCLLFRNHCRKVNFPTWSELSAPL